MMKNLESMASNARIYFIRTIAALGIDCLLMTPTAFENEAISPNLYALAEYVKTTGFSSELSKSFGDQIKIIEVLYEKFIGIGNKDYRIIYVDKEPIGRIDVNDEIDIKDFTSYQGTDFYEIKLNQSNLKGKKEEFDEAVNEIASHIASMKYK